MLWSVYKLYSNFDSVWDIHKLANMVDISKIETFQNIDSIQLWKQESP